jgi:hypothetical protein
VNDLDVEINASAKNMFYVLKHFLLPSFINLNLSCNNLIIT